ncbi:hypothetical protein P7K49_024927 [Saguinus oedipus]|uniref:Essential protein Yae1 N-terminal domain-containing protein n=1 Tax=Saguinus oedipus TaxID=9490 RepID=A0ABQ9UFM6_SAGOE|nr:hypothetical protein P7K49_024927 [Saguinus oedipus]
MIETTVEMEGVSLRVLAAFCKGEGRAGHARKSASLTTDMRTSILGQPRDTKITASEGCSGVHPPQPAPAHAQPPPEPRFAVFAPPSDRKELLALPVTCNSVIAWVMSWVQAASSVRGPGDEGDVFDEEADESLLVQREWQSHMQRRVKVNAGGRRGVLGCGKRRGVVKKLGPEGHQRGPALPSNRRNAVEQILIIVLKGMAVVCAFWKDKGNLPQISYTVPITIWNAELLKQKQKSSYDKLSRQSWLLCDIHFRSINLKIFSSFSKTFPFQLKEGYRDGVDAGKAVTLQQGFNQGYKEGAEVILNYGQLRGTLSALLSWCHLHNNNSTLINKINNLLDAVGQCEKYVLKHLKSVTPPTHVVDLLDSIEDMDLCHVVPAEKKIDEATDERLCENNAEFNKNCSRSHSGIDFSYLECCGTQEHVHSEKPSLTWILEQTASLVKQLGISVDVLQHLKPL